MKRDAPLRHTEIAYILAKRIRRPLSIPDPSGSPHPTRPPHFPVTFPRLSDSSQ